MLSALEAILEICMFNFNKATNMAVCSGDSGHVLPVKICEMLSSGSLALLDGRSLQAVRYYEKALGDIKEDSSLCLHCLENDITVLCYVYGMALVDVGLYDELHQAVTVFTDIISVDGNSFPVAYYGIGKAYVKLNQFKDALSFLNKGLEVIKNKPESYWQVKKWPGTSRVIKESCRETLVFAIMSLLDVCLCPPPPDATCLYQECTLLKEIRYSDPGFSGFIELHCSQKCILVYHPSCYKAFSAKHDVLEDNDILSTPCMTPDCGGTIVCMKVINLNGLLEREMVQATPAGQQQVDSKFQTSLNDCKKMNETWKLGGNLFSQLSLSESGCEGSECGVGLELNECIFSDWNNDIEFATQDGTDAIPPASSFQSSKDNSEETNSWQGTLKNCNAIQGNAKRNPRQVSDADPLIISSTSDLDRYSDMNIKRLWNVNGRETVLTVGKNISENDIHIDPEKEDLEVGRFEDQVSDTLSYGGTLMASKLDPKTPDFVPKNFSIFDCDVTHDQDTNTLSELIPSCNEVDDSSLQTNLEDGEGLFGMAIGNENSDKGKCSLISSSYLTDQLAVENNSSLPEDKVDLYRKEVFITMEKFLSIAGPMEETDSRLLDMESTLSADAQQLIVKEGGLVEVMLQNPKISRVNKLICHVNDTPIANNTHESSLDAGTGEHSADTSSTVTVFGDTQVTAAEAFVNPEHEISPNLTCTQENLNAPEACKSPLSTATKKQMEMLRKDVHVFMENFLSIVGPLEEEDERLLQIMDVLSNEARELISMEGGLIPFLLQDSKILQVHKFLCYNADIKKALEMYHGECLLNGCTSSNKETVNSTEMKNSCSETFEKSVEKQPLTKESSLVSELSLENSGAELKTMQDYVWQIDESDVKIQLLKKNIFTIVEKFLSMTGPMKVNDKRLKNIIDSLDATSLQLIASNGGLVPFLLKNTKIIMVHEYLCYIADIGKAVEICTNSSSAVITKPEGDVPKDPKDEAEISEKVEVWKEDLPLNATIEDLPSAAPVKMDRQVDMLKKTVFVTMERFLNITGPMRENDDHLLSMTNVFSDEAQQLIANEGGFIALLLQDPKILRIHGYICHNMDIQKAIALHEKSLRRKTSCTEEKETHHSFESPGNPMLKALPTAGLNPNAVDFNPGLGSESGSYAADPILMPCSSGGSAGKETCECATQNIAPLAFSSILDRNWSEPNLHRDEDDESRTLEGHDQNSSLFGKKCSLTLNPSAKHFYPDVSVAKLLNEQTIKDSLKESKSHAMNMTAALDFSAQVSQAPSSSKLLSIIYSAASQNCSAENSPEVHREASDKAKNKSVKVSSTQTIPSLNLPSSSTNEISMPIKKDPSRLDVVSSKMPWLQGSLMQTATAQSLTMSNASEQNLVLRKVITDMTLIQNRMRNEILSLHNRLVGMEHTHVTYSQRVHYHQVQLQQERQKIELEKQALLGNLGILHTKLDKVTEENRDLQARVQLLSEKLKEKEKEEVTNKALVSTLWKSFEDGSARVKNTELHFLRFQKVETMDRLDHLIDFADKMSTRMHTLEAEWSNHPSVNSHLQEYRTKCLQYITNLKQAKEAFLKLIDEQIGCVENGQPLFTLQPVTVPVFSTITEEALLLFDGMISALKVPNSIARASVGCVLEQRVCNLKGPTLLGNGSPTICPSYSSVVKETNGKPRTGGDLGCAYSNYSGLIPHMPHISSSSGKQLNACFNPEFRESKPTVPAPPGFLDNACASDMDANPIPLPSDAHLSSSCVSRSVGNLDTSQQFARSLDGDGEPCSSPISSCSQDSSPASNCDVSQWLNGSSTHSRDDVSPLQSRGGADSASGGALHQLYCNDAVLNNPNNVTKLKKRFRRLRETMQLYFPHLEEEELQKCIVQVYAKNKRTLSGMTYPQIAKEIEEILINRDSSLDVINGMSST